MDNCPPLLRKPRIFCPRHRQGVTIIEVLIVAVFLALLAVLLLVTLRPTVQLGKGRDARRKADLSKLKNIFEDYYNDKKQYPSTLPACGQPLSGYLDKVPCDPRDGSSYGYTTGSQSFRLYAKLEYDKDKSIAEVGCQNKCGPGCAYNWGISSSNVGLEVCAAGGCSGSWWACQAGGCNNFGPTQPICTLGGTAYCDDSTCGGDSTCASQPMCQ